MPHSQLFTKLEKLALASKEDIELSDFTTIRPKNIEIIREPFPHIVVHDFFKKDIYDALCDQFNQVMLKGLSKEKGGYNDSFHEFEINYDGYVHTPPPTLAKDNPTRLFFSLEWNMFFSKLFNQFTTFETSVAFHHHPIGDRTGFVHHDFADKQFRTKSVLPNKVIAGEMPKGDDTVTRRRIISLLIYLNNPPWQEGDGGETGIYTADRQTLLSKVPPINNTLFAFHISPKSMHAFQGNNKPRNSIVQWFHIPPEMLST